MHINFHLNCLVWRQILSSSFIILIFGPWISNLQMTYTWHFLHLNNNIHIPKVLQMKTTHNDVSLIKYFFHGLYFVLMCHRLNYCMKFVLIPNGVPNDHNQVVNLACFRATMLALESMFVDSFQQFINESL